MKVFKFIQFSSLFFLTKTSKNYFNYVNSNFYAFKRVNLIYRRTFASSGGANTDDVNDGEFNIFDADAELKSLWASHTDTEHDNKRVFILQPRMQFKSKTRQTMNADLQLEESIGLIKSLNNWKISDVHIASTKTANKSSIWGSGNIEILSQKILQSGANCLFIGIDRLSSAQIETIRKQLVGNNKSIAIYDRYTIVLKIFKLNARTTLAKLQISLAELDYMRYKLANKELYQTLEKKIKSELEIQAKKRDLINQNRRRLNIPSVSIIGYTNNGKTSLIKYLTNDSKLEPKNRLFATLDVTYHGMKMPNSSMNVILIDTIGFISDIPYNLIEAFKVTLNDALESDLLVHVLDITHPACESQESIVLNILKDLDVNEQKLSNMITVYNKYDKLDTNSKHNIDLKNKFNNILQMNKNAFAISCVNGFGINDLLKMIETKLISIREYLELVLKVQQGSQELSYLYKNCTVKQVTTFEDDENAQFVLVNVLFDKKNAVKFIKSFPNVKVIKKV